MKMRIQLLTLFACVESILGQANYVRTHPLFSKYINEQEAARLWAIDAYSHTSEIWRGECAMPTPVFGTPIAQNGETNNPHNIESFRIPTGVQMVPLPTKERMQREHHAALQSFEAQRDATPHALSELVGIFLSHCFVLEFHPSCEQARKILMNGAPPRSRHSLFNQCEQDVTVNSERDGALVIVSAIDKKLAERGCPSCNGS